MSRPLDRRAKVVARSVAGAAAGVVFLLPLFFMVMGSLRTPGLAPGSGFTVIPRPLYPGTYGLISGFVPLGRMLLNSLLVAAIAVPVTVVVASWAGFAIATAGGRSRRTLIGMSIAALLVPGSALWIPRFLEFRALERVPVRTSGVPEGTRSGRGEGAFSLVTARVWRDS